MIIWGSKVDTKVKNRGKFMCPRCNSLQTYYHRVSGKYFTLFFIPLFVTKLLRDDIECQNCFMNFDPTVLDVDEKRIKTDKKQNNKKQRVNPNLKDKKIIVICENCSQKIRLPIKKNKIIVTCPTCSHKFPFRYYWLGFSSSSKKPLFVGIIGSLVGFTFVEIVNTSLIMETSSSFISSMLSIGVFGLGFGAIMGASEGILKKDRARLIYGFSLGIFLGLLSGLIAGLVAQFVFVIILSIAPTNNNPSFALIMLARTIGWSVLGLLIGVSHGIKDNTRGDVKFGLIGGIIGGSIGGLLFDPLSLVIQLGGGTIGRFIGFTILGIAISVAVNQFREVAIIQNRPEMYKQLTDRLPSNLRLPPGGTSSK